MFVVPKKKHKRANKRNIIKRRMREAYRLNKQTLYESVGNTKYDIMFVYLSIIYTLFNYQLPNHSRFKPRMQEIKSTKKQNEKSKETCSHFYLKK